MSWGKDFLTAHGQLIEKLGSILIGVGEVVPIAGGAVKCLGLFAAYFGTRGVTMDEEKKLCVTTLEYLLQDLNATYDTLLKYCDEDRKVSNLTLSVKVMLTACHEWSQMIENRRVPRDLSKSIAEKREVLKSAIGRETLEQTVRIDQRTKLILVLTSIDKKKPMEYYNDAYYLINKKRWMDAKYNLMCYRNYVEAKTPVHSDTFENGVCEPAKDRHLKWLMIIQDKMAEEQQSKDPIISSVMSCYSNVYKKQWEKWEATYCKPSTPEKDKGKK